MHEKLRKQVSNACNMLSRRELCDFRRGIVSAYDRKCGVILIKPDKLDCAAVTPIDVLAVTDDGAIIDGEGSLPEKFATHREIYHALGYVNSIVSSNPTYATAFAQAGRPIKPYGTTHAEYFGDAIPCTRRLTLSEIEENYSQNLGRVIVETLVSDSDPNDDACRDEVSALLVCSDEVYSYGESPASAIDRMAAVEGVAKLAFYTELLMKSASSGGTRMQEDLLRLRYERENKK
ncbi:MAG: hypothetical protein HFE63_09360 [Clostridiales bacterium]|nr:hypothetical protein [Clostridiales bacterium]